MNEINYVVCATGGSLPCGRYLLAPLTGNLEVNKELMQRKTQNKDSPRAAIELKSVIERLKFRSPPRSRVQTLEAPPPGQHPLIKRPKPKAGLIGVSFASPIATCRVDIVHVIY